MSYSKEVTLDVEPSDAWLVDMHPHAPGERLDIYRESVEPSNLALSVYAEEEPGIFTIEKMPQASATPIAEAAPWMLEGTRATIGPPERRFLTHVLITPSILDYGLYGGRLSRTEAFPQKGINNISELGFFSVGSIGQDSDGKFELSYHTLDISVFPKMIGVSKIVGRVSVLGNRPDCF